MIDMPYKSISQLPSAVKDNLPSGAQRIWMSAYNYAIANPKKIRGEPAQYAWGAVKRRFKKVGDKWVKKSLSLEGIVPDDFVILHGEDLLEITAFVVHELESKKP